MLGGRVPLQLFVGRKPFTSCSPFGSRPDWILTASLVIPMLGMRRRCSSHFLYDHSSLPLFRIPSPLLFIVLLLLHCSLVFCGFSLVRVNVGVGRGRIVLGGPQCWNKNNWKRSETHSGIPEFWSIMQGKLCIVVNWSDSIDEVWIYSWG